MLLFKGISLEWASNLLLVLPVMEPDMQQILQSSYMTYLACHFNGSISTFIVLNFFECTEDKILNSFIEIKDFVIVV